MDSSSETAASRPLARCGGCGHAPGAQDRFAPRSLRALLRRVGAQRPVGVGASCAGCDNRRHAHLRHFELGLRGNAPGGRWIMLCHNCAAAPITWSRRRAASTALQAPRRDRRWDDRRADRASRPPPSVAPAICGTSGATACARCSTPPSSTRSWSWSWRRTSKKSPTIRSSRTEEVTGIHLKTSEEPAIGTPGDEQFLPISE